MDRRRYLAAIGAGTAVALAGCGGAALRSNAPDGGTTTDPYPDLTDATVYRATDLALAFPAAVPVVEDPADAELVVLPDDTAVAADAAVSWLAGHRHVALVGDDAEETFHGWKDSEAFREAFESSEGRAETDPEADLLVARRTGSGVVGTERFSWSDGPTDAEYLGALDEALGH